MRRRIMKTINDLSKIVWNNRVDEFYSDQANVFRFCSLAAIFAFAKWIIGTSADMALLWAFAGSTSVFGVFLNRIRNIAASVLLILFALGYYYILGSVLEKSTGLFLLNPQDHPGFLVFLAWLAIVSILWGIAFLIGNAFFNRQMPQGIHHAVLYCLFVLAYFVMYSWVIIALACYFVSLKPICLVVVITTLIIALFTARKPARNISWDLFVARNANVLILDEDTKAIVEALPAALKSPRDIPVLLTLATKYAQCDGIMRNAEQCIRWSEAILDFLEGPSADAHLRNTQTSNMDRYLAHMLLYIVYERSERFKSPSKADQHKKAFDHQMIEISNFWFYWNDPNLPFEDKSDTRYFGIPYANLQKIAKFNPDAYCTLYDYCIRFAMSHDDAGSTDLAIEYLKKGMDLKSSACQRKFHMLQLAREAQNIEDSAPEVSEEEKNPRVNTRPQYSLNSDYPNITISGK